LYPCWCIREKEWDNYFWNCFFNSPPTTIWRIPKNISHILVSITRHWDFNTIAPHPPFQTILSQLCWGLYNTYHNNNNKNIIIIIIIWVPIELKLGMCYLKRKGTMQSTYIYEEKRHMGAWLISSLSLLVCTCTNFLKCKKQVVINFREFYNPFQKNTKKKEKTHTHTHSLSLFYTTKTHYKTHEKRGQTSKCTYKKLVTCLGELIVLDIHGG
jgi:hypothetical protein